MEKKLKIQSNGRSDEFGTPKEAIEYLLPYIKNFKYIWECAWGKGLLVNQMVEMGFIVLEDEKGIIKNDNIVEVKE
jgi:hypothetical protein